jgi:small neutral amino acid transporter SnatA (MarC family)
MHWPGATVLLLTGLSGLVILFLPLLAYDSYKEKQRTTAEKLKNALGFTSIATVAAGSIFKVGHLTGGAYLLVGGTIVFTFGFLPLLFFAMYKKSLQQKFTQEPVNV